MRSLIIAVAFIICGHTKQVPPKPVTMSITEFGAVGDGTTDNYYAFKLAAAYASTHANTTINFPVGTYYIAKYRTVKNDTVNHIKWNNCVGLKLIGVPGTIISMNGTFFRPLDLTSTCPKKSYTSGLSPFWFFHCSGLEIRNIEVTGNVQNTTRAPGVDVNNPSVTESESILLRFTMCTDVVVDSMYLHHAECDGLWINGDRISGVWVDSRNFTVSNVRSFNNARQGMSVGGLVNGHFYKCQFKYTGFTGGTYEHNDPAAGVDNEPGPTHYDDSLKYEQCIFEGNYGSQFICSYPATQSNLTLLKDTIIVSGDEKPQAITLLARYTLVDSCYFVLGNRDFKITNPSYPGSTIQITHSTISSTGNFMLTSSANMADSVVISNNQFNWASSTMTSNFFTLQTNNLRFLNNNIYVSPTALATRPTGYHVLVRNAIISQGNVFSTGIRVDYTGTTTVSDP